ncbi:hypothetical protein [Methylobacterium sp. J-076]|uniref:hypothetical protein n=1 Tax=Methylobacterium sp. J-076 TaxID=2836655 RepID=UPI001FBA8EE5|nr:hypothetical protein [Methylobacterium sp. J-076]MCJ2015530.1 hypothetical protein [Methylobacterium sp. J-076]
MRLYHFTSLGHLPVILATGGLWRGEVPLLDGSRITRANWLTSDPDPGGHGLDGSEVDKRAVRIEMEFGPREAYPWLRFASTRAGYLEPQLVEELVRTGGGQRKARSWYVYPRQIPPSRFLAIKFRRENGGYSPATPSEIEALVPHEELADVAEELRLARLGTEKAYA